MDNLLDRLLFPVKPFFPCLHFEIRKRSVSFDPRDYLE